jgi:hypothetical protein
MPVANVVVQQAFTADHEAHPSLPDKLSLQEESAAMFKAAPNGVAFTGVVHIPGRVIYLHPLVAVAERGNVEMVMRVMEVNGAGTVDGVKDTKPILHPNMSQQLRAQSGLTSGHHQICTKHKLGLDDCVGFAITKLAGENRLTTNSRTLNSDKFVKDPQGAANLPAKLKARFGAPVISDGNLSKKWAYLIAITVEIAFTHYLKNPQGHCEAPF